MSEHEREVELLRETIENCKPKNHSVLGGLMGNKNNCSEMEVEPSVQRHQEPVVEVVKSDSYDGPSLSEVNDDDDEDETQLRIIEGSSPAPDINSSNCESQKEHHPLYHVPFSRSPRPSSLGDAKYPIVLDGEPLAAVETDADSATNVASPDEGYSSSTSPFDSRPQDFGSLLPFAGYDEPTPGSSPCAEVRKRESVEHNETSTKEVPTDFSTDKVCIYRDYVKICIYN